MKKILLLAALLAGSMTASAQDAVTASVYGAEEGNEWFLRLGLNNTSQFVAFQTDITLPAGVALAEDAVTTFSRLNNGGTVEIGGVKESTDFVVAYNQIDATANVWRIVAYNLGNTPITGNEGELMAIKLVAEEAKVLEGVTPTVAGLQFVNAGLAESTLADITEVPTGLNGDANADKTVDAADAVMAVGKFLGTTTVDDAGAADVNADGVIDSSDAVEMISIFLGLK